MTDISKKPITNPRKRGPGAGITTSLSGFLHSVADAGMDLVFGRKSVDGSTSDPDGDMRFMCNELLSTLGEASGTALARRVMDAYIAMDEVEKLKFFYMLRSDFHVDFEGILSAAKTLLELRDDQALDQLLALAEPPRQELFRRLNMAPNGTESLVEMRKSLLKTLRENPDLKPVDTDLSHLFASWFNRGFLTLRSIDWYTPAAVLEKLIEYETVHEMTGWDDLRRRLASDRRCFAFFHSALPNDPLVFVEVALVKGLSTEIHPIIDLNRAETPLEDVDTAIFYSINNCLEGLKGISFGNFLIKQVVVELAREFPQITVFSTLSPVPGFCGWLEKTLNEDPGSALITDRDRKLLERLQDDNWFKDEEETDTLRPLLTRLIAYYLVEAKRGRNPVDAVARFHLRNGARLDQINWLGDTSDERMRQSCGFLVNYVYDLSSIERNHENYVKNHVVVTSQKVADLARLIES